MIACALWDEGEVWMSFLVALAFHCYFRPSEPMRTTGADITPPLGYGSHVDWSIVLHPFERQITSKTKAVDETVRVDLDQFRFLEIGLATLVRTRGPNDLLFSFTQAQWAAKFAAAAKRVGADALDPQLYQLRHSGPSFDYAARLRTIQEIKLRGRWAADNSVRRYEKAGRVTEQLRRLGRERQKVARSAPGRLATLLSQL